ncbi:MAG: DNA adenine methylase [Bacteroidales bacterium]|nr:DNA adenine methylase [Bacteroidales bacterium]
MNKNQGVAPFLKWVGGKRQLMASIADHLPNDIEERRYFEPFIGGGAVLFYLQPVHAVINDFNEELINVYNVVKNHVDELIADLKQHENTAGYFYQIRSLDRNKEIENLTPVQRASRVIYLNKTCFNGLYRVNKAGEFNVPFGRYKKPNIVNVPALKAVNKFLNQNNLVIYSGDYANVLTQADKSSFVYLDPPYHPVSESSNFTGYVEGGWGLHDQTRLRDVCNQLNERGVKFLLSNSSAPLIKELYKNYAIVTVKAARAINANGAHRGQIDEVLVKNYE